MKLNLSFVILLAWAQSASAATIPTVPIGNPSNVADMRYPSNRHPSGVGSVPYTFLIGKTEITNAQYVEFLNAVARTDTYGLYATAMATSTYGGIIRSGSPGSFSYTIKAPALGGTYTYDNKPVGLVSWGDVARFCNWLHNGQPIGLQNASTSEDGAYTLNGATSNAALSAITRNTGARWWIPNVNEWYKAAYFDPASLVYRDYPTGDNAIPNNNPPSSDTGNSANFNDSGYTTGNIDYPNTDVGSYVLSGSPYGTFDQGGNVWEWTETVFSGSLRSIRGGVWFGGVHVLKATGWTEDSSALEAIGVGFRVAGSVPEPNALLLAIAALTTLLTVRRKSVPHNRI